MSKNLKSFLTLLALILSSLAIVFTFKTLNKKSTDILKLSPAPVSTNYLYQSFNKGFAVYLGNRSKTPTPEVKFAVENSSINFSPENNVSDKTKLAAWKEPGVPKRPILS